MAILADNSGDVNSNLVTGTNSRTLTFTMPGNVAMKVLSVVATINNGAATAVTPELTIRDQSGVVIATKRQGSSIPAGDTGTATFALRLPDSAASTGASGIQFDTYPQAGNWLYFETGDATGSPSGFGIEIDDNSGGGFFIGAFNSGDLVLGARGGGKVEIDSTGGVFIHDENTNGTTDVIIQSTFSDLWLVAKRTVKLNAGGAAPVELRPDGTYHIKTGAVWVADL